MADEMLKRSEFLEYMTAFEERLVTAFDERLNERLGRVDGRFDGVDRRFDGIDQRFDGLEGRMNMQFDETRGLIRLSLEGLDALRETTERGFAESDARIRTTRPCSKRH